MQEDSEASVETIAFTLSETGSCGRVSTYVVTGSLRLLMEKSVGGKGRVREPVWEATTMIQASSNGSNGRGSGVGFFVCFLKKTGQVGRAREVSLLRASRGIATERLARQVVLSWLGTIHRGRGSPEMLSGVLSA